MAKLTDTQLIVLAKAAASDDGAASVPERMTKAAAIKVGSSLVARKLMREVRAKAGMAVWREDENGRSLSLVITRAGRDAIGVEAGDETTDQHSIVAKTSKPRNSDAGTIRCISDGAGERPKAGRVASKGQVSLVHAATQQPACSLPREGSKQALVITMLRKSKGASIEALVEATGWLPHTTRAALTGLRKRGFAIELTKETAGSVYRIVDQAKAAA